jgi:hypothetical protein
MIYGKKTIPFELNQLTWFANPKLSGKRYLEFKIKKKSGSLRSIHAPVNGLKAIQKALALILGCVYEPNQSATGFLWGKSILDNAQIHVGSRYVYNVDLKDFFPSIDQARVWKCLQLKPFNLSSTSPRKDFQQDDSTSFSFWNLPKRSFDVDINELIWKISYTGYFLNKGNYCVNLKDGGKILYKIEVVENSNSQGIITVFIQKSDFKIVRSKAEVVSTEKNLDFISVLKYFVWQLIENHQKKIHQKNSRIRIANIIASLCCTEMEVERKNENDEWGKVKRNVLPQGAPTSPVITNIVCQKLDYLLSGVAKRFGLKYSRYADDITFSSMHNVYQPESEFLKELHRIIAEQNFHIKESKTRLQKDGYRKEVTGLLVNEKANVQQRYIKQLRMWLYYWERYGYERASVFFLQQYIADKGHVKNGKPDMANVIAGKLDYLKMVKGGDNELYLKLKSRLNLLICFVDPINQVLNVWETDGIEQAMDIYYKNKLE